MNQTRITAKPNQEFVLDMDIPEFLEAAKRVREDKSFASGFASGMSYVLDQILNGKLILVEKEETNG